MMRLRSLLTPAISTLAAVGVGLVNPAAGVALGSSLAAGGFAKAHGQARERRGGRPLHKITAPAAAIVAPTAVLAATEPAFDPSTFCDLGDRILSALCHEPGGSGVAIGLGAVLLHTLTRGAVAAIFGRR